MEAREVDCSNAAFRGAAQLRRAPQVQCRPGVGGSDGPSITRACVGISAGNAAQRAPGVPFASEHAGESGHAPRPASAGATIVASAPRGVRREVRSSFLPLPAASAQQFDELPSDPRPAALIRRTHYWAGNERSLHLCHAAVLRRGGAYLGVGTDQNYLLAGWARSEFAVIVDFDQSVVDLHRGYRSIFEHAPTPSGFVACWADDAREQTSALLRERHGDGPTVRAFRMAQPIVAKRLLAHLRMRQRHAIASFVDDGDEYAHVRSLVLSGRMVAVRGDYDGDVTMPALAQALRDAELPVGVLYLSNVEQYLDYTPRFRRNILGIGIEHDAVVVRTVGRRSLGWAPGEKYHYNVQPAAGFAAWMRYNAVRRSPDMLDYRTNTIERGLSMLEHAPQHSIPPPIIAE